VSWIERLLEERLARAAADGELDAPALHGRPIADLDRQREPGWWAERFVARERSHDRRQVVEAGAAAARAGFWRAETLDELRRRVDAANAEIVRANASLVEADRLPTFVLPDVEDRWRRVRTSSRRDRRV
jgi:hypothetical protein